MRKWTWVSIGISILILILLVRLGALFTEDRIIYGKVLAGKEYSCQKAYFFERSYVFIWKNSDKEVEFIHVDEDYSQIADLVEEENLSEVLVLLRAEDGLSDLDKGMLQRHYDPADPVKETATLFSSWNVFLLLLMVYPAFAFLLICLLNGIFARHSVVTKLYCIAQLLLIVFVIFAAIIYFYRFVDSYDRETAKKLEDNIEQLLSADTDEAQKNRIKSGLFDCVELRVEGEKISLVSSMKIPSDSEVKDYYGETAAELVMDSVLERKICSEAVYLPIGRFNAVAGSDNKPGSASRVFLLILPYSSFSSAVDSYVMDGITNLLFVFGILSLALIASMLVYRTRWRRLNTAIDRIIVKKEDYSIPKTNIDGFIPVWNGISQAHRALGNVRYDVLQGLKIGLRFVPKNLIDLFEKKNLTDITIGDYKSISGCVIQISMDNMKSLDGEKYMELLNTANEIMSRNQEKIDAIRVSCDADLKKNKFFFKEDPETAISFAIDVAHELKDNAVTRISKRLLMINHSEFFCGMSGYGDQIVPFVYSKDDEILENYEEQLRNAGVEVVLTENVLHVIKNKNSVRYIGYVSSPNGNRSIKLYENLDVYTEFKHKVILSTEQDFQKGLKLFYSDDFYLARNTFNEVIQINPNDQIARWYLFTCEHYLNAAGSSEVSYSLFESRDEK